MLLKLTQWMAVWLVYLWNIPRSCQARPLASGCWCCLDQERGFAPTTRCPLAGSQRRFGWRPRVKFIKSNYCNKNLANKKYNFRVCYEIFELKFSKISRNVISNNFSKTCYAIENFEFWIKVARALDGISFLYCW